MNMSVGSRRGVVEMSSSAFTAASGLEVSVVPIVRAGRTVGGRIAVRSVAGGPVVPGRVSPSGVMRGLPLPDLADGSARGEWEVRATVRDGDDPTRQLTPDELHVSQGLIERSPTMDVLVAPTMYGMGGGDPARARVPHELVVQIEWSAEGGVATAGSALTPIAVDQVMVGVPAIVVAAAADGAGGDPGEVAVVVDGLSTLHTVEDVRDALGQLAVGLDIVPGAVPLTVGRVLEETIALVNHAEARVLVADHGTVVLPFDVGMITAFGDPSSQVQLVLPSGQADRAWGAAVTVGRYGLTSVRGLRRSMPDSTPVRHVSCREVQDPWVPACAPFLHFVD